MPISVGWYSSLAAMSTHHRGAAGLAVVAFVAAFAAAPASGEVALSFYGGTQSAPHSGVSGTDPTGVGVFDFNAGWDGKSFSAPPYYGVRAVWWRSERFGFTVDFTHSKVLADTSTLGPGGTSGGFETLEFTDGLNNLTFGVMRRWPQAYRKFTPYVGASLGVVIPHVEVKSSPTATATSEYQFGGPSVALVFGVSYPISDRFELFGEYKGTYSQLNVDLKGGGNLSTDIITNALNIGITYKF